MLLSRQRASKKKDKDAYKYSPHRRSSTNYVKLNKMIHSNSKYINVPHGIPDHLKRSTYGDR